MCYVNCTGVVCKWDLRPIFSLNNKETNSAVSFGHKNSSKYSSGSRLQLSIQRFFFFVHNAISFSIHSRWNTVGFKGVVRYVWKLFGKTFLFRTDHKKSADFGQVTWHHVRAPGRTAWAGGKGVFKTAPPSWINNQQQHVVFRDAVNRSAHALRTRRNHVPVTKSL